MKLPARRRQVALAQARLAHQQVAFGSAVQRLRARIDRHGSGWIVGVGLAGGAAAGLLPVRALARAGRAAMSLGTLLMRLPLRALINGVAASSQQRASTERTR
jgi:hypothetical protein